MIYKMTLKDSVDTMTFNLLETPIVDKDIEGAVDNVTLDGNQYTDYLYLKKQYIQKWAIMCPDEYDELRGFYTRQFEEGEVPSYRVYYGANVTRDYTFNGDYFKFNAEGIETGMTLSQLTGNAEQETTTGKNLFGASQGSRTDNGVTSTIKDGVITLNGTTTGAGAIGIANQEIYYTPEGGDTYTFTIWLESGTATFTLPDDCGFYIRKSDGTSYATGAALVMSKVRQYGYQSTTFTAPSATPMHFLISANKAGIVFNNVVLRVQVEKGSTKTDWEEYTAGASPNPSYPQAIETVTGAQTVQVTGKNLLPTTEDWEQTLNGVNIKYESGVYTFNGTSTSSGSTAVHAAVAPYTIRSGDYFHYCNSFASSNINVQLFFTDGTSFATSMNATNRVFSIDIYNGTSYVGKTISSFRVNLASGQTFNGTASPMILHYISTVTAYTPYQGQSHEIKLLQENLLPDIPDGTVAAAGITTTWSNGTAHITGTNTSTSFNISNTLYFTAPLQVGETYTFSMATTSPHKVVFRMYDTSTQTWSAPYEIAIGQTSTTTRLPFPCDRVAIYMGSVPTTGSKDITLSGFRFGRAIELAKIGNYQDYIWNDNGTWKLHKSTAVAVLNGTENWAESGTTHERFVIGSAQTTFSLLAIGTPSYKSKCDYFKFQEGGTAWTGIGRCGFDGLGTFWCMISGMSSLADFKAWLGANNVRVYYPLATPTDTEITDETLLYQLNFLASLYKGENNISLVGTGAQGEMEVFIRDVMSVETDVVPEVPVRLTLTDDGVINACGCRRNVQLTMRETTE